jgi:flagellar basal-body rod modification protein FlgD
MESNNIVNPNSPAQNATGNSTIDAAQRSQRQSAENGANGSEGLNGSSSLAEDFDSFLNLLTTQLQNQDPLDPMKSNEFTNQLVKFSEVEQALKTNDKLDELLTLQGDSKTNTAVSMIGKNVEAQSDQLRLEGDSATIGYSLEGKAQTAAINIANQDGEIVRTLEVNPDAGEHEVTWDGTDSNGNDLDDGVYTMKLSAVDSENKTVKGDTFANTEVKGFEERDGTVHLQLGGFEVKLDDVKAVRAGDGNA